MEAMRQQWSDDRLDHLQHRMEEGFRLADERADRIEKSVEDLGSEMRAGFAALAKQIDERFEQVDARFEQVDERFKQVDARFEQLDSRFDRTDKRIGDVEERLFQLMFGIFIVGGGLIGTLLLVIAGLFTSLN
jgi:DNA repair ATPase RecN